MALYSSIVSLLLVVALLWPAAASAHERKLHAGGGLALSGVQRDPYAGSAIGLVGSARYELTDQFLVLAELTAAPYNLVRPAPDPCPEPPAACEPTAYPFRSYGLTATAGLAYTIDVTRLMPYVGVMVGGSRLSAGDTGWKALLGQRAQENRFDFVLALGADYQLSPALALGGGVRLHSAPPGGVTEITQLFFHVQRTFAW